MKNKNKIVQVNRQELSKINSSINLTKKIISQGISHTKNQDQIKLIPFSSISRLDVYLSGSLPDEPWYLYNLKSNKIISGPLDIVDVMKPELLSSFFLCRKDNFYYIIDINYIEYSLGAFKNVIRNGDYILGQGFDDIYYLFQKNKFICKISKDILDLPRRIPRVLNRFIPDFEIIEGKVIHLKYIENTYGRKYISGWYTVSLGYFDFNGNMIDSAGSDFTEEDSSLDFISIKETLWTITEKEGIYFDSEKIFDDIVDVRISDFYSGYAFMRIIWDVDPEFGVKYVDIGYIDVYGNYYWTPSSY